ncbi:facilitated trehalose transporter Tret1-like isoform X2 [Diabrotica undecimpunctata]|uniref:facilitated trehalose transporter Tret1-like isoform X2 n=1 Tax=Diabrotica undecimpunctata TaxID=50387 RepID=UPI003B640425
MCNTFDHPSNSNGNPKYSVWRQSLPQIIAVFIKNTLLFIHGMSLGFPTILVPGISGNDRSETILFGQDEISWISSINLIFIPMGCLISGSITQAIGRKRAMQIINIPFIVSWLLFHFSTKSWIIFVAASILGFSGGLLEAPVLTYVAEVTQPHLRGILSCTGTMTVTLGMLSQFILGSFMKWRTVTLVNCFIPIISFLLLMIVPETPVWLISKNRIEEAKKSIAWLRGWTAIEDIQDEFQELHKQIYNEKESGSFKEVISQKLKNLKLFSKRIFIYPSSLLAFVFFLGHFNGYGPFQVYAIKIFQQMEVSIDPYYLTIILGVMQLLGSFVCVTSIRFLGKRTLTFFSLFMSGICCLIVGIYAYNKNILKFDPSEVSEEPVNLEQGNWIPATCLILFGFFAYVGIKGLPFILIGELFAVEIRAFSSGFSAGVGYVFGFIANKTFLGMVSNFGFPWVFWFYTTVGLLGAVGLYFVLPETEGKTLYEISEHFAGRTKLSNSVRRNKKKGSQENGCHNVAFDAEEGAERIESKL